MTQTLYKQIKKLIASNSNLEVYEGRFVHPKNLVFRGLKSQFKEVEKLFDNKPVLQILGSRNAVIIVFDKEVKQ